MKIIFAVLFLAVVVTTLDQAVPTSTPAPDAAVRQADEVWAKAIEAKSVEQTIAMYDPENEWDVKLFHDKTPMQQQSQEERLDIPPKYYLTGGGAAVDSSRLVSAGKFVSAFLVSSYPEAGGGRAWIAQTHDHINEDLHHLEAYAIGIRPNNGRELEVETFSQDSKEEACPSVHAMPPESFVLVGGGAQVHEMPNHHLFASYPGAVGDTWHADSWCASSTEHQDTKHSKLTAYAIGIVGAAYSTSSNSASLIDEG